MQIGNKWGVSVFEGREELLTICGVVNHWQRANEIAANNQANTQG